jgi:Novel STAND NTPase 2
MDMNPYQNLTAVRNPDMFYGRATLLRRLFAAITSQQSVSLIGSRHMGKSSLLKHICHPTIQQRYNFNSRQHILISIDLREYLSNSTDDFFEGVCRLIINQSRQYATIAPPNKSGKDKFSDILDLLNDQGLHPVLLMDAFDNIARNEQFDPDFFSFLRAEAMKVSYVTASIAPLNEISHKDIKGSPFFNIFVPYTLDPLTLDEARALITEPAMRAGLPFTPDEIEFILRYAGRHPFFIQRACYYLFEEKSTQAGTDVDRHVVRNQFYRELKPHFEDSWTRLDEAQQELLKDEAQLKENTHRKLPELSESALFRQFVRDKCQISLFRITADYLEELLDHIDDAQFLGTSELKHLRIANKNPVRENMTSTMVRGMAVREVLSDAFEKLRGNGVRSDAASEWRLYNILFYRYFKNHLKNDQISARLGFSSTRQYFRDRSRSIEALYKALMEMEALAEQEASEEQD